MNDHRLPRTSTDDHGLPWMTTDCHILPWTTTDHQDQDVGHSPMERKLVSSETWGDKCRKTKTQCEARGQGRQDGVTETLRHGEPQHACPREQVGGQQAYQALPDPTPTWDPLPRVHLWGDALVTQGAQSRCSPPTCPSAARVSEWHPARSVGCSHHHRL